MKNQRESTIFNWK